VITVEMESVEQLEVAHVYLGVGDEWQVWTVPAGHTVDQVAEAVGDSVPEWLAVPDFPDLEQDLAAHCGAEVRSAPQLGTLP